MNQNQKKQTGRSMIEMLGVLAIIGVLSIGAISGYKMAIRKYRTNELLHEVYKRAGEISIQLANGRAQPSIAEFPNNTEFGFRGARIVNNNPDRFFITFDNPGADICREILKRAQLEPMIVKTEPPYREVEGDNCTNRQTIDLYFNKDLSSIMQNVQRAEDIDNEEDCMNAGLKWCYVDGGYDQKCKKTCCERRYECAMCRESDGAIINLSDSPCENDTGRCDGNGTCIKNCAGVSECKICDPYTGEITGNVVKDVLCNSDKGLCDGNGNCITPTTEPIVSADEMSYADAVDYCEDKGGMFTVEDFNCTASTISQTVRCELEPPGELIDVDGDDKLDSISYWLAPADSFTYYGFESEETMLDDYESLAELQTSEALFIEKGPGRNGGVTVYVHSNYENPDEPYKALCKGN